MKSTNKSKLLQAMQAQDIQQVKTELAAGANPNARHGHLTLLMIACGIGQAEIVELLLEYGADPFAIDSKMGMSALHIAAQSGHVPVAELLVDQAAAIINLQSPSHGFTPLMNAVWHRQPKMVEYLLSLDQINTEITSILGNQARELISQLRIDVHTPADIKTRYQAEAKQMQQLFSQYEAKRKQYIQQQHLMAAILNSNRKLTHTEQYNAVKHALLNGAEVNAIYPYSCNGSDGHTPILVAARDGHAKIVKLLLEAGADVSIGCGYMIANPAHKAAYQGHADVMQVLADHPSFSKIKDVQGPYNGYTPLMDAVWHGHTAVVKILLKAGVNTQAKGWDNKTALDLANEFGYSDISTLLKK
jgi:ankyrin repeat protein